ncbi:exosortase-associated EpsI family protein [Mucisphaera sp.]|uniref:exosortase-associated EpsI family protein n=1 Tax=Mucisphaera sp. TaxID=2913024 RepID=UPI003D0E5AA4
MDAKREALKWGWFVPCLVALVLMTGHDPERQSYAQPVDAQPYHDRVREEVLRIPGAFDGWTSEVIDAQREAVQLLKPNVIYSRRYEHSSTGEQLNLLIVHCREARDMVGHYPPICYPSSGWTEREESRRRLDIEVRGRVIEATEYEFFQSLPGYSVSIHVINTMLLPDGRTASTMDAIAELDSDYRRRFFGAGQLQVLIPGEEDPAVRERLARTFIGKSVNAIEVIGSANIPGRGEEAR